MLVACILFAIVFNIAVRVGGSVRTRAFRALAERSRPLVAAIEAYTREHGDPPRRLSTLVPGYLPAPPATGMAAYPSYELHVGQAELYFGNPWVLEVPAPRGVLNFDRFVYLPNGNYEDWGGVGVERIGDWAYLHE